MALIKGKRGSGTGFLVRPGIIATNAHVIDGESIQNLEVRFPSASADSRGPLAARLLHQDKIRDLAFLAVVSDLPALPISSSHQFRKGEDIIVIGNPGVGGGVVLENAISRGLVSSQAKLRGQDFLQLGVAINPGNSGGPVFDEAGEVIGVATLKTSEQEGLAFCIPAADLSTALAIAENKAKERPTPEKSSPIGDKAPTQGLVYGWKIGRTFVYSVSVSIEAGPTTTETEGSSIYQVKSVDNEGATISHKGWLVTKKRGKDGKVIAGGIVGPTQITESELKIDSKGNVLKATGATPISLLGDLSMLIIEPLPDGLEDHWEDSQQVALNEIERIASGNGGNATRLGPSLRSGSRLGSRPSIGSRVRPGLRGTPAQAPPPQVKITQHPAQEQKKFVLGASKGHTLPISKTYEMATDEVVDNEPVLKLTGSGTIAFDPDAGLPLSVDYKAKLVVTASNASIRIPFLVTCRLLDGEERRIAMRPPAYVPTALNPIKLNELDRALANLKSRDPNRQRAACKLLRDAAPINERRGDASRMLEKYLDEKDNSLRNDAIIALGVWGDSDAGDALVERLVEETSGSRDQLFEALGRLPASEASVEAVLGFLGKDSIRAGRALRAIGPLAEPGLVKALETEGDPRVRAEICQVLKEVGGSASLPALEKLSQLKDAVELARAANDSIRSIAKHDPSDDDWVTILIDTKSRDRGRRRKAVEKIRDASTVDPRRAEVSSTLIDLLGDEDQGIQVIAIEALGSWGDDAGRAALIAKLDDKSVRPFRELIRALGKLGPHADSARAIARWQKKDARLVKDALSGMGQDAETVIMDLLRTAGDELGDVNDYCQIIGKVGTSACVPMLEAMSQSKKNPHDARAVQDALEAIRDRNADNSRLKAMLAELKSSDPNSRRLAAERLSRVESKKLPRADVARALDDALTIDDAGLEGPVLRAMAVWGDSTCVMAIEGRLSSKNFRAWKDALRTLALLRPDQKTAEIAIGRLHGDFDQVISILRIVGPRSETALLAVMNSRSELQSQIEASKALGAIGTSTSLPTLQALASGTVDEQLARNAEEAVRAITSRAQTP